MNPIIPQASLFMGVIPALIILYVSLKNYEGYYKDKVVFLSFFIGIVIGFIAAAVMFYIYHGFEGLIVYIAVLAFFDQLFKTIVLNFRRLQEKKETPIYGLTLGLAFGASFTPVLIIVVSSFVDSTLPVVAIIAVGSMGIIFFHGATGAFLGYGIYVGELMKYLVWSILLQIPLNLLVAIALLYSRPHSMLIQAGLVAGILLYSLLVFGYVMVNVLPQILKQGQKRKRTIKTVTKPTSTKK